METMPLNIETSRKRWVAVRPPHMTRFSVAGGTTRPLGSMSLHRRLWMASRQLRDVKYPPAVCDVIVHSRYA